MSGQFWMSRARAARTKQPGEFNAHGSRTRVALGRRAVSLWGKWRRSGLSVWSAFSGRTPPDGASARVCSRVYPRVADAQSSMSMDCAGSRPARRDRVDAARGAPRRRAAVHKASRESRELIGAVWGDGWAYRSSRQSRRLLPPSMVIGPRHRDASPAQTRACTPRALALAAEP